ncbi:uncharacterized protein LOC100839430 [Brachypodium distachyon]|uniref:uncharacterized protein LOC100839430 n=1 Tax=Brachypodium distachyon TaxID=15368 RepID=UPI000D0CD934|nr:uncharacterized protein LOC100839430 [Brachypodium distachyon]|eukprot:XP_024319294.1 uncharacterized protein LOC100839430 [Brachypodium distachyon]
MDSGESSSRLPPQRGLPRGRCGRRRRTTSPDPVPTPTRAAAAGSRCRRRLSNASGASSSSIEQNMNTPSSSMAQNVFVQLPEPSVSVTSPTHHHRRRFDIPSLLKKEHLQEQFLHLYILEALSIIVCIAIPSSGTMRDRNTSNPSYNLCCKGGRIKLPPYAPPPQPLMDLLTSQTSSTSRHFFEHIQQYNAMFAMTSMGAKVIESINDGHGPYVFKISGQVCHRIGTLRPCDGHPPEYCQLYIYDTENEITNRINVASSSQGSFHANQGIVASLIRMLDINNPIVQLFRSARERLDGYTSSDHYRIRIFGDVDAHGDIFSAPVASEVVGLIVSDVGATDIGSDLIVEDRSAGLQQINGKHRKFMSMQYPLLFPYREDGYHESLVYQQTPGSENLRRKKATMLEYYCYRFHDRTEDFNTPLKGKRLTQSYEVDAYCCVEGDRIGHYRKPSFQRKYRSAPYNSLANSVSSGVTSGSSAGQWVILPSSFTGGPRYLYQNYQDCIAICRKYGCPDLFITFTSNPAWPEIAEALASFPGQQPSDRPDIVDRVFKMKLNHLMDDIKKKKFFGPINAVVYTIEFQKRGLPHVHIILWLASEEPLDAEKIDLYISAQLPGPTTDPIGYEAISSFMIHGPCGPLKSNASCMSEGKCSKNFPNEFCEKTSIDSKGFAQYARPNNWMVVNRNGINIDNRFIVSHNVDLVVKYQAHINVERVNHDGMHKYLFKYVTKGFDCSRVGFYRSIGQNINEINNYLECRYVTPHEVAWRIFQYDIHHTDPSVERLPVHLPLENNVVYVEDDNLEEVISNPENLKTKLTAWLEANRRSSATQQHTYIEFPEHWTWHSNKHTKYWDVRKGSQRKIGRVANVSPAQGELFYLRMLLYVVKGSKSFSEIRTIGNHECPTYRAACESLRLLGDDQEWSRALTDAAQWATVPQLLQLFVTMLLFCEVTNPKRLFDEHVSSMSEDSTCKINWNPLLRANSSP